MPDLDHWPHAPTHRRLDGATYFVTGGTYLKRMLFKGEERLDFLQNLLFQLCNELKWELEAWAIFPNHYHFVAHAPAVGCNPTSLIRRLHSVSARWLNEADKTPGRKVWYQYWDTCITNDKSHLARLRYVHTNPERHRVAEKADDYRWCSMRWFLAQEDRAWKKTVLSFPCDRVHVKDDF